MHISRHAASICLEYSCVRPPKRGRLTTGPPRTAGSARKAASGRASGAAALCCSDFCLPDDHNSSWRYDGLSEEDHRKIFLAPTTTLNGGACGATASAIRALMGPGPVEGFCYTQLTDVEQERNGLLGSDRRPKVEPGLLRAATETAKQRRQGSRG